MRQRRTTSVKNNMIWASDFSLIAETACSQCLTYQTQPLLRPKTSVYSFAAIPLVVSLKNTYQKLWEFMKHYETFICTKTNMYTLLHTVAIWTFTFHKKSGFVMVILKANFKPAHRPVSWTFWSENSDLLYPFSFYFRQELSNPLLFAHCCCYFNALTYLSCNLIQKCDSNISSC